MRESGPRQPRNLDPIDRDTLADMGRRIERWDLLKDQSRTFGERKAEILKDLDAEIESLMTQLDETDDYRTAQTIQTQIDELAGDADAIDALDETEEAFEALADKHSEYYKKVREEFLKLP